MIRYRRTSYAAAVINNTHLALILTVVFTTVCTLHIKIKKQRSLESAGFFKSWLSINVKGFHTSTSYTINNNPCTQGLLKSRNVSENMLNGHNERKKSTL